MKAKLAALLTISLVAGFVHTPVKAETVQSGMEIEESGALRSGMAADFFYEEMSNGTLAITQYDGNETHLVIPSELDGKEVTEIREGFYDNETVESITIPKSVIQIGGENESPFEGCWALEEIIVEAGNAWYKSEDGVLYNDAMTELICCPQNKQGSVTVPDTVTKIKRYAFAECYHLEKITIGKNVNISTDNDALYDTFSDCRYLKEFVVNSENMRFSSRDGVLYDKSQGKLYLCPMGKTGVLTIPASVHCIGSDRNSYDYDYKAFGEYMSLSGIEVENDNRFFSSEDGVLYNKEKTTLLRFPKERQSDVTVPDQVKAIGDHAFEDCSDLETISLPEGLSRIGSGAFKDCIFLSSIMIPESVTSIESGVFDYCLSLESVQIPDSVTHIETRAFSFCQSLEDVQIPDSVTHIESKAFECCLSLESVRIPKNVVYIGGNADDVNPDPVFSDCENLTEIIVDENSRTFCSLDGILYSKDMERLLICPAGKKGKIEIPQGVKEISSSSFNTCGGVTSIFIPESMETPDFGRNFLNTFYECFALKEFIVDEKNPKLVSVDGILYEKEEDSDTIFKLIRCPQAKEGSLTFPDYVQRVGSYAFEGCVRLTDLIFPHRKRLNLIESYAFQDCIELKDITILSPKIIIREDAFNTRSDLCIHCVEGDMAEYARKNGINYEIIKKTQTITASNFTKTLGDAAFSLGADTNGKGDLTYKSSNDAIASVSQTGMVTLKKAGTVKITITASETDDYYSAQKVITITINPKKSGTPNKNEIPNKNETVIKKLQTISVEKNISKTYGVLPFSLNAKTNGGGALTYLAQNASVATVDRTGLVTVKGCGSTVIQIKAAAKNNYKAAETTITLTVAPKNIKITSVKSKKPKTITVKWKKDKKASGYIIECATDKKFKKNKKTAVIKKNSVTTAKISKLKNGKKYYVRVCAYANGGNGKILSEYTKFKKAVKTAAKK